MSTRHAAAVVTIAYFLTAAAPFAADTPTLVYRATYFTGLVGDNAEVISVRHTDGIAAISNTVGSVDVLDLSDPLNPSFLIRVPIDTTTGPPNSVAVHPQHDYFLVVTGRAGVIGTLAAHDLSSGALLASVSLGLQPDAVAISPNGQYAVVANEAESTGRGATGGPGSLSIVSLAGFNGVVPRELEVTNLAIPSLAGIPGVSSGRTDGIGGVTIDHTPGTIEPEYVTFSADSRYAFVTLQENNVVIRLEVRTGAMRIFGLGHVMHAADLTNGGGYVEAETLVAFREPDGIAVDQTGRFFVTADEGDTNNAAGSGSPRGGRTLSVFDARTGAFIADTGQEIDHEAAEAGVYPDGRSNRGGSEPEGVDLTSYRGLTLAVVALERANAVALVDLSDPTDPDVIDIASLAPAVGPETVKFLRSGSRLFVATGNEVSGSVSILEVVF